MILYGDALEQTRMLHALGFRAQTCVTSPPYFGLRDYGHADQIGLERTPDEYVARLVEVFRAVRDVLADDGTLWLNTGDTYARAPAKGQHKPGDTGKQNYIVEHGNGRTAGVCIPDGLKEKDLIGIPWMLAFALRADGWWLRQDIIWHKPNPMPESVTDRCTKAHEYMFMLSKSAKYYYDGDAVKESAVGGQSARALSFDRTGNPSADLIIPGQNAAQHRPRPSVKRGGFNGKTNDLPGREAFRAVTETRNRRSVWTVATRPYAGAHFAVFPSALIEPCILAGSRPGDVVFDPFMGSGTTAMVAKQHGRKWLGCELNETYRSLIEKRLHATL